MTTHELKDQRQLQILDAAATLFAQNGFDRTSVDEIAKQAGLSKGAIYWYFPSKERILIALAEHYETANQMAVMAMASNEQFGSKALYLAHRHFFEQKAKDPLPDLLFQQFISMAQKYPEISEALQRNNDNWTRVISSLLEKSVAQGDFKPFDTTLVAEAISAIYRGICTARYDDPERALNTIEYATRLFYDALQPETKSSVSQGSE